MVSAIQALALLLAACASAERVTDDVLEESCGIGKYTCVGEQYNAGKEFADKEGFNNITGNEVDVVKALGVPGWWKTTITAGTDLTDFVEEEYCTKEPGASDRLEMTAGSSLLCVTGNRTDMTYPKVFISYFQTTCDSFTKVILAGPSGKPSLQAPSISRVTCHRVSGGASGEKEAPAPSKKSADSKKSAGSEKNAGSERGTGSEKDDLESDSPSSEKEHSKKKAPLKKEDKDDEERDSPKK
mmetsp:Transcript_90571/g.282007  ORF Transcript_90571/g.282007 Transcript_90571/m.282007 type:complete len:242 (+) Transcript_90571:66-791(+)|eukprot:CAMPEP_0204603736 /NCGR_PEP_ID=MMETSP0661-20131031/57446_1 /ASSEMBLY_ACC=CAM_ASM_000606 /TAXON_ID=109239 /ORGANISM="Alexandrium margalefi, Strain AMGDE01CS-322" /LENGTH=241 /DNA_ID=CAMNT_0051614837 /DNA_START=66 /DNA_END=791 /DNA_ORIENTATION=-